jgi:AcrR family transcriptional regulator
MPKQTFLNLPEAKRKAFLDAAIEEFAGRDYESASISHIVAQLGIAKGSVYQYFADKRDLYLYLIDLASQERIAFVKNQQPPDAHSSFFAYTQWLLEMGVRFTLEHPRLNQIIYRAMFGVVPFRDEMLQRMKDNSLGYIRQVIVQGIAAGEIDPDLDLDLVAYLLNLITYEFGNFLVTKQAINPQRLITGDYAQLDMDALRGVFRQAAAFIWYGLAKQSPRIPPV